MKNFTWPDNRLSPAGGWDLSTEHSASSYGIPVLVDAAFNPYGPADLLSVAQVAELRGIAPANVHGMIRRGTMEAYQIGHAWVVEAADAVKGRTTRKKGPDGKFV